MNVGLVQAITLGLLRCAALGLGVWVNDHYPTQQVFAYGLVFFAFTGSVYDKFKVNDQITSSSTPSNQG